MCGIGERTSTHPVEELCKKKFYSLAFSIMLISGAIIVSVGFVFRLWATSSKILKTITNKNEVVSPLTSWKRGEAEKFVTLLYSFVLQQL